MTFIPSPKERLCPEKENWTGMKARKRLAGAVAGCNWVKGGQLGRCREHAPSGSTELSLAQLTPVYAEMQNQLTRFP